MLIAGAARPFKAPGTSRVPSKSDVQPNACRFTLPSAFTRSGETSAGSTRRTKRPSGPAWAHPTVGVETSDPTSSPRLVASFGHATTARVPVVAIPALSRSVPVAMTGPVVTDLLRIEGSTCVGTRASVTAKPRAGDACMTDDTRMADARPLQKNRISPPAFTAVSLGLRRLSGGERRAELSIAVSCGQKKFSKIRRRRTRGGVVQPRLSDQRARHALVGTRDPITLIVEPDDPRRDRRLALEDRVQ